MNEFCCCESCNNATVDEATGTYICNQKAVIENYMPTDNYWWCQGEVFRKKVKE